MFTFQKKVRFISTAYIAFSLGASIGWCQNTPDKISRDIAPYFEQAVYLMNNSKYDSAQWVLSAAFIQTEHDLSAIDLFYLHSLESEIMYYNALFEQGLNTAIRAHALVEHTSDSILLGSAENLLGLLLMNLKRNEEAVGHLRKAARLLPRFHNNSYLSYNYQAGANLGECYIRMQMPDSAIAYTLLSLEEADSLGKERGLAIAIWNIAESKLMQGKTNEAVSQALKGLSKVHHTVHRDVVQMFCSTLMRAHEAGGQRDSALHYLQMGLLENDNALNTDFSRIDFLDEAAEILIRLKEVERAAEVLSDLKLLTSSVGFKEQRQRIEILKQFYEKNRELAVTSALNEAQRQQLKLRDRQQVILVAVAILLIIVLVLGYGIFRQRQRIQNMEFTQQMQAAQRALEIKAVEDRVKALNNERNRIASDLHDDIGASLSGIRIYSEAALMQVAQNPEEGLQLLRRIKTSAAGVMERMGDIVWSISPRNDGGENMLLRMKTFATDTLGPLGILPSYEIDAEVSSLEPGILARKNIYLIFKEAVNNAAKYSKAKNITISMQVKDCRMMMELTDDGIGFDGKSVFGGHGLRNMRERAHAIGAALSIDSTIGSGTTVKLDCAVARISDTAISRSS